ncbi:A-kinase anchor protein 9 isoform X3 [Procambarus clarkii]|uniref:A-kinase anchor protein 9 isoform X3 n=1 Tax=Procambarus clarkii TaxID=6728 RepID=UPI001E67096E|nr:A-kinase anchor protein 9-like isoform X3 [Procambarus clarkii]
MAVVGDGRPRSLVMEAPGAPGLPHQLGGEENNPIHPDAAVQSPGDKLQDKIDAKQQTIEALQHENYKLRLQSTVSSSEKKEIIEQYNAKIQEFQSALNQRDQMIGKLQTRLAECIQNQDDKEAEYLEQVETHRRQVENLNLQLKKTTDSLLNKDWSSEHLQLQNKIQILMKQLQEVTTELARNNEKHQIELTTVQQQFEQQLTIVKQQISERHNEELSRIKSSHDYELSQVTQQIDALEKAQKEDHTSLIENLNSLSNLNISLKEQLEGEKVKLKTLECSLLELRNEKELLKVEVEHSKEREKDLHLRVKQECDTRNVIQQTFEELKTKYGELQNVLDISKEEAMTLNANLKVEVEKRNNVEKQLAVELQNVKNLSEEKLNLENKLENINSQMNVMSKELLQSKASKENLNADYQKTLKIYNEILCEHDECKRLVVEHEVICKDLQEEKQLWVAEKSILADELRQCTEMLKIEESKVENEIKSKIELEKEISILKGDNEKLTKRCDELAQHEQDNKILTEKLLQMHSDLKEAENKSVNADALREKYLALVERWQSVESNNEKIEEQCKEKCECLNKTLQSLDSKLEAASGITVRFQEIGYNKSVVEKLKEAENNISFLEEALKNTSLEKEALVSDLMQTRIARDSMEREKNECETDRDRMLEQYKMMKAELASAQLALDREFQLSTHRRLTSDIGLSVSTSSILEPNAIEGESNTDSGNNLEGHARKEMSVDVKEFNISTIIRLKPSEKIENSSKFWEDKIHNLEKENKELLNEIEQLKTKIHDQHFSVKSLENEKLKLRSRLNELESEKVKFRAEQEDYQRNISEKMNLQRQLDELKLTVHLTEDNLKKQEEEMNLLQKSLKAIILRGNCDSSEKLKDVVNNLDILIVKPKSNESQNCSRFLKSCVSRQSEELQCMCEELKKYMSQLLDVLQQSDKLNEEKMIIELENFALKAEVKKLKYLKSVEICKEDIDDKFGDITTSTGDKEDWKVERELHKYKHENWKLRLQVEKHKVLFRLEKLHLQSSLINSQKDIDLPVDIREMVTTYVGMELEKLIEEWEDQIKNDPSLTDFISAQICKVCDIIRKLPGTLVESSDGGAYVKAAMKLIQQAVIKNVGGQYMEVVKSLLVKLDKDVTKSLQVTLPTVLLDLLKNISLSEDSHDPVHSEELKSITDKVEHLINARNTLVEAANEFVEQLEAAVALRTSCIKHELDDLVKLTALKVAAKENPESSKASTPEELNLQVEAQQQFVQEFMEITTNVYQEALSEKLQILKSQKMMVHKILEDNQRKLHTVCQEHLENLRSVTNLPDALKYSNNLVSSLEKTLSQEVSWVDQQYMELLEQYSYEQNRHKESQTLTLQELKTRLVGLFKSTDIETELKELKCQHKSELMKLREQHAIEVHRLERQLAARDQVTLMALDDEVEQLRAQIDRDLDVRSCISNALCSELENIKIQVTQRHLQSLYSDRDWYKKTVGLLSHVTLQLLHYYSVAESYTTKSQDHKINVVNIEDHGDIQQPEMSSGKIVDLSFLSDCMPDDNDASRLNMLPEDSVLPTGLISKTVYADQGEDTELTSNSGSVFDSTAMSEGMLDDVDKDEQVRSILTKSYPQLMSILKGRWDRVVVENLEKEVQELTISLQASAGMFKIFMHSVSSGNQELSSHTIREETEDENASKETLSDPSQQSEHHLCEAGHATSDTSSKPPEDGRAHTSMSQEKNESFLTGTFKAVLSAKKKLMSVEMRSEDNPTVKEDAVSLSTLSSPSDVLNKLTLQDLDDLSESLSHLLSQDESLMNFTKLKPQELRDGDKLKKALKHLCQNAQASEGLRVKLHHLEGLLKGLEEEKKIINDENSRLNHYSKKLAMELQVAKDQIEELELGQQGQEGGTASTQYAARMEASKDIRERVRAALSVKNKSLMDHNELVTRVGDLEGILEVVVRDNDIKVEALNFEVADLTQQLEVADRQLRSSRQFLEEHASERDQEMEDLMHARDKLTNQLREKDTLLTQHASLEKEVENLERQLREKSQELQDALASKEEIQVEHKAAVDKIWDLREIIQSLEVQVDGKCVEVSELNARNEMLSAEIEQARQHSQDLTAQLEEHRCAASEQGDGLSKGQSLLQSSRITEPEEDEENNSQQASASLFMELRDEYGQGTHNVSGQMLLQIIEERLDRTTRGLEALQMSASSASQSAEDLSVQDNLHIPALEELEADDDAILPASVDQRLEDKLLALERTMEAAVKYTRDLEMTAKILRVEYEEVTAERDMLQEHSKEQLVQISSLEARLDELRRSDHPMNAELKQRLNVVQEDLEKKRTELTKKGREIEELKHNLSSTRGKLMSREEELQRMQSNSQPHSLPQTTSDQHLSRQRQLEDEVAQKNKLVENLKKKLVSASNPNNISSSLAESLIEDKNAEIKELNEKLSTLKSRVNEVITLIANGGSLEECQALLKKVIERYEKYSARLSDDEAPEIMRKSSHVQQSDSPSLAIHGIKESPSASTVFSSKTDDGGSFSTRPSTDNLTLMSVQPDSHIELSKISSRTSNMTKVSPGSEDPKDGESFSFDGAVPAGKEDKQMNEEENAALHSSPFEEEITITKEEYERLCSASGEVTVLRAQVELLQEEITSLNDFQTRLEEDFKAAQELLEAREEEIMQLSDEIEDSGPLPLPSETLQMQDKYFRLEEQVSELQERLREATAINREYEEEMLKLDLRTKDLSQEIKELQENINLLRKEIKQKEELLDQKERCMQDIKNKIEINADQNEKKQKELRNEVKFLHEQLERLKQQHIEHLAAMQLKTEEVAQLSAQLDLVHSEMQERLSHSNRDMAQLEQQYQKEISDLKEEQILREKQLCSDYEERMAAQVSDLSVKLSKDKEEAIARLQHFYTSALQESNKEKEQIQKELQDQLQRGNLCNQSQQISRLCDFDGLSAGGNQDLDKLNYLDNSLVSYVKDGHARADAEQSTRASSAVSDISDGDESCDVASRVQRVMNKVHKDGIEMLTLIDLMFLQKHQTHLDSSQKSLISRSGLIASGPADGSIADLQEKSSQYDHARSEGIVSTGERTQLLRRMAALEEELSKRDQEMTTKVGLKEFQLEQEMMSANEWKLSFEAEKKRTNELMDQLREEKLASVDQVSELTFLRSQLFILRLQLQKAQEENNSFSENVDSLKKEIETLKESLQAERNNFSHVSKVLSQQRRLAAVTRTQQDNVIKDLRNSLDKERERSLVLYSNERSERTCITPRAMESDRIPSGIKDSRSTGRPTSEDLKMQLAVEKERFTELQRSYERERLKVVTQNEQAHAERARARVDLMEEQGKCAELTKTVRNLEMEKDALMRQMSSDRERLQSQESRIRVLEGEIRKLEGDLRAQADAHQIASHRVRDEDTQLHISYTRTLNKLGEAEAELCTLRHKQRTLTKDLELAREKEEQLQKELATEKMAINRLGLPALARINNLDEYFELQLKENLELCKSVLRLTDDRQSMRQKIHSLENTVTDLTGQLAEAKAALGNNPRTEKMLKKERSIWERERISLQKIISQKEGEVTKLQEALYRTTQNVNNTQLRDERMQHIYGKYIQSEHWRKALIWQKRYLLVVIKGYRDTEHDTLSRLHTMASRVNGPVRSEAAEAVSSSRIHRFRVGVLAVIAICRMKNMIQRYRQKRQLGLQFLFPTSHAAFTITSAQGEASESSRPGSSDQVVAGGSRNSITGLTPPTKGPSDIPNMLWSAPSSSRRSLFHEEESPRLNEYIERLDNIHSVLGLNSKNI